MPRLIFASVLSLRSVLLLGALSCRGAPQSLNSTEGGAGVGGAGGTPTGPDGGGGAPTVSLGGASSGGAAPNAGDGGGTAAGGQQVNSYSVTVANGYGSGTYAPGQPVDVWSIARPSGSVYNAWTGSASLLTNSKEWVQSFVMPASDVSLEATFFAGGTWSATFRTIQGELRNKNVYYHFPIGFKGLILMHHGTGGSANNWMQGQGEYREFCDDAVAAGYGILATEAEEVTAGDLDADGKLRWLTAPIDLTNIDIKNTKIIVDLLIAEGVVTAATPIFALGMSNGGFFAPSVSAALKSAGYHVKGQALYCGQGNPGIFSATTVPTIFALAANDSNTGVNNEQARTNAAMLSSRGISNSLNINPARPLYKEKFARGNITSVATSELVFHELKSNNHLDGLDFVVSLPVSPINATLYPALATLSAAKQGRVQDQLEISQADHKFFSDLNKTVLQFFNAQLP